MLSSAHYLPIVHFEEATCCKHGTFCTACHDHHESFYMRCKPWSRLRFHSLITYRGMGAKYCGSNFMKCLPGNVYVACTIKLKPIELSPYDVNTQCITVVVVTASAGLLCFLQDCAGVCSKEDIM